MAFLDQGSVVALIFQRALPHKIPSALFELKNTKFLYLHDNNLRSISPAIESLGKLEVFAVSDSKLQELPVELVRLPSLTRFESEHLPALSNPPSEIAYHGIEAIRNYFESIDETREVDYLYEAKMVLVGRGLAGKTSLVRKLTIPDYSLEDRIKSTEGIDIATWDLQMPLEKSDHFRFNVWDFGGQEKYDATHQFFITERTVYLFVTEARQESNYLDFDYWLNIVQMLGNNSPVIVVQNKWDVRKKSLPTKKYRAQFPNITDFVQVSCANGWEATISELSDAIKQAVRRLPQVGEELPGEWVRIRRHLKELDRDHIDYTEYRAVCGEHGLSKEKADFLSRYLHDLGVIVHYHRDPLLKKMVVLNPDWVVDGVYNVLDTPGVEQKLGRFTNDDLMKIWSEEKYVENQAQLLALMKNYEICFQLPGTTDGYIAPELFAADPVRYEPISKKGRLTFISLLSGLFFEV